MMQERFVKDLSSVSIRCYIPPNTHAITQKKGFENASQPGVSDKDKADLLHFVVVGGGPTVNRISRSIHIIYLYFPRESSFQVNCMILLPTTFRVCTLP